MTDLYDIELTYNDGSTGTFGDHQGKVTLVVNTASRCGFTPQYQGLQQLQDTYEERGFTVLGVPCNQFGGQEPGTAEDIAEFCSLNYGVDFRLTARAEVNGENSHPLFGELKQQPDAQGESGEVKWNFEKFLVSPEGELLGRFRSAVTPAELAAVIEGHLPK